MTVEIVMEDVRWAGIGLEGVAEVACNAVLAHMGLDQDEWDISLLACDDARIAALNIQFRGKPLPTNVLSWPVRDLVADEPGGNPPLPEPDAMGDTALGDIAIAFETCQREAEEAQKPMADHVMHLVVHGVLHLLGYDHIDDADATLMETIETGILGRLGLADPYTIIDGA